MKILETIPTVLIISAILSLTSCAKEDNPKSTYTLLGISGTINCYYANSGIIAPNTSIMVEIEGVYLTGGTTNSSGKLSVNAAKVVSGGNSINDFPSHITIHAHNGSYTASGSVKVIYSLESVDGTNKYYRGKFNVNVHIG